MNNHRRIGIYCPNNSPMYVYYDPDSQDIYCQDVLGGTHLLTGIDFDTTDPDGGSTLFFDDLARYLPTGFCGIIRGLSYNWLLGKDNTACKVHCGVRSDPFPFTIAPYKSEKGREGTCVHCGLRTQIDSHQSEVMNKHLLVGVYVTNNKSMHVYHDPYSQETYYQDEQGGTYLLAGFELDTTNPVDLRGIDLDALGRSLPVGVRGTITGFPYNWMLGEDGMARKVLGFPHLDGKPREPEDCVAYTDNMEYKPKKA